jgi:hypothetical protein
MCHPRFHSDAHSLRVACAAYILLACISQHPKAVTGDDLKSLRALFDNVRDTTSYHSASFTAGEVAVIKRMLQWPTEHILPVLDCVRVLMMHAAANAALGSDEVIHTRIFQHVRDGKATHQILLLKTVSNWVAKRQRTVYERLISWGCECTDDAVCV